MRHDATAQQNCMCFLTNSVHCGRNVGMYTMRFVETNVTLLIKFTAARAPYMLRYTILRQIHIARLGVFIKESHHLFYLLTSARLANTELEVKKALHCFKNNRVKKKRINCRVLWRRAVDNKRRSEF